MSDKFDTPVTRFYTGKTVFITGSTGFVGKVLLEKLLYAVPDVECAYVLVREKRGVKGSERIEQLIKSAVFAGPNRIPQNVLRTKIVPIYGDLTLPGLGLSDQHREIMVNEVNIILHCAASVHFDDPVKEALKINFLGTKSLADLCHVMKHLEAFVHVSTCYSNCQLKETKEVVYKTKIGGEQLMEMSRWMDDQELDKMAERCFYDGRPNSYVFTKALAENYVHDKCQDLPVAIARLPIVLPAIKEPEPGFVDTAGAGNFVILTLGLGAARTFNYDPDTILDLQAVDHAANGILLAARDVAINRQPEVKVFNMGLGSDYKSPMVSAFEAFHLATGKLRSYQCFRPVADVRSPPSRLGYLYKKYVMEYFFAFIFDLILLICGKKSFALKKTMFVSEVRESLEPFMRQTFTFHNDNFKALAKKQDLADQELFDIDTKKTIDMVSTIDAYVEYLMASCKRYMKYKFNEDVTPENLPSLMKHARMLDYREMVSSVVIHAILAGILYFTYRWMSFVWQILA